MPSADLLDMDSLALERVHIIPHILDYTLILWMLDRLRAKHHFGPENFTIEVMFPFDS